MNFITDKQTLDELNILEELDKVRFIICSIVLRQEAVSNC